MLRGDGEGDADERITKLFQERIVKVLMELVMLTGSGTDPPHPLFSQERILDAIWPTSGEPDPDKGQHAIRTRVRSAKSVIFFVYLFFFSFFFSQSKWVQPFIFSREAL